MKDYIKRMVDELQELKEKYTKLKAFLDKKPDIPQIKLLLLDVQRGVMSNYIDVLEARLKLEQEDDAD